MTSVRGRGSRRGESGLHLAAGTEHEVLIESRSERDEAEADWLSKVSEPVALPGRQFQRAFSSASYGRAYAESGT